MTAHAAAAGTTDRQDMEMPPDPPTDMPLAVEGGELFVQPTDEAPKMDEVKAAMMDGAESGGAPPPPTVKHYDQSHPKVGPSNGNSIHNCSLMPGVAASRSQWESTQATPASDGLMVFTC